ILEAALKITATQVGQRARVIRDFRPIPSVDANAAKLGQVFVNLLVNAAQALVWGSMEKDEIRVVTYTDPAGKAVVEIHDSGSGIPRESLSRIFEPFYTTKPPRTGRGLGLAICHEIVTALGGAITVESEPGRGSIFRVLLPRSSNESGISKAPRKSAGETRRGRILVVDDEPIVGASIRRTLAKEHEVVVVSSGREAIGLIHGGHCFDLILSDVMMPEMSGIEFYRELERTLPDIAERMVFLTGGAFTPGARKFLDSVSNPSLEKPFDPDRLRDFVRERLV
ncbi:MAG TPA: ATP-binding protein, partial [Myxococcales bacterium]